MTLIEVLNWVIGAGGSIIMASWILERIVWFQNQISSVKEVIFFVLSSVFGVGAYLIVLYVPAEAIEVVSPYFGILFSIFSTVFIGEMFHKIDKAE